MIVLGINGGLRMGYQDVSAVLVRDGKVVAAVEEERLNRKKHAVGQLPYLAVQSVLDIAGVTVREVDALASHGSTWGSDYETALSEYFNRVFGHCPPVRRVHHHLAHAASAYYASGMDEAMVLTMDASGDGIALQKCIGRKGELTVTEQIPRTNSLGIFYSMMTQYCGFHRDTDEYKLMGLAPYGNAARVDLSAVLAIDHRGYTFNPAYIKPLLPNAPQPTRQQAIFTDALTGLLGPSRLPGSPIGEHFKNVAAASQQALGDAVIAVVSRFHEETGLRRLCLAGGVALNCAANQRLMNLDFIDELYVQPAAGDQGVSLGAAYLVAKELGDVPHPMDTVSLGREFPAGTCRDILKLTGVSFRETDDPAGEAARRVAEGQVVGWFQGRMEFGPRALGNRSILADPVRPEMQGVLNQKIKFRESFRPFCPSVSASDFKKYFRGKAEIAPYMTINFDVREPGHLPSIAHVDQTARVQTVSAGQNPLFHEYLQRLGGLTGHPVSINTSFNRNQEPIVHTPIEAISAFYGSGMDALILDRFVMEK